MELEKREDFGKVLCCWASWLLSAHSYLGLHSSAIASLLLGKALLSTSFLPAQSLSCPWWDKTVISQTLLILHPTGFHFDSEANAWELFANNKSTNGVKTQREHREKWQKEISFLSPFRKGAFHCILLWKSWRSSRLTQSC